MTVPAPDEAPIYAVRLALSARETLLQERARQSAAAGPAQADAWYAAMLETLRSLATYPQRCPIAPENALLPGLTVRQRFHGQRRAAWRLLFTIHDADANDPPTVRVHHIRHSAQQPLAAWVAEDPDADNPST